MGVRARGGRTEAAATPRVGRRGARRTADHVPASSCCCSWAGSCGSTTSSSATSCTSESLQQSSGLAGQRVDRRARHPRTTPPVLGSARRDRRRVRTDDHPAVRRRLLPADRRGHRHRSRCSTRARSGTTRPAMPGAVGNFAVAAHRTSYGKPFNGLSNLQRRRPHLRRDRGRLVPVRLPQPRVRAPDRCRRDRAGAAGRRGRARPTGS